MKRKPPKQISVDQIRMLINRHDLFIVFVDGLDFRLSQEHLLNARITNGEIISLIDVNESFLLTMEQTKLLKSKLSIVYSVADVVSLMQIWRIF